MESFNWIQYKNQKVIIDRSKITNHCDDWLIEMKRNAELLNNDPALILTGSINSEIMVRIFYDINAKVKCFIPRYMHKGATLNSCDVHYSRLFCDKYDVPNEFLDIEIIPWLDEVYYTRYQYCYCMIGMLRYELMKIIYKKGFNPIKASFLPALKRIPNTNKIYMQAGLPYIGPQLEYLDRYNIPGIVNFFSYRYESALAYINMVLPKMLSNPYKILANRHFKIDVFKHYWPDITKRPTIYPEYGYEFHGTEHPLLWKHYLFRYEAIKQIFGSNYPREFRISLYKLLDSNVSLEDIDDPYVKFT